MPETPEQKARRQIDAQLAASGWIVQDKMAIDFNAGPGIAVSLTFLEQIASEPARRFLALPLARQAGALPAGAPVQADRLAGRVAGLLLRLPEENRP